MIHQLSEQRTQRRFIRCANSLVKFGVYEAGIIHLVPHRISQQSSPLPHVESSVKMHL